MAANKALKLKFTYLHQLFTSTVLQQYYPNGYVLYKVSLKAGKYWFLKYDGQWKVFGDFKLGKSLKELIITNIEQAVQQQQKTTAPS
ncbi:hypothetical protein [Mucilaginibacter sp. PAMB04168]|uniref:hypothetical protein n=1 Tax=Mucilaginibacter sp. PAMB04168 TaxID=3138567 RepID=UPI0031F64DBC